MISGVVAEISNNHNGSIDLAKRLILEAYGAGADWVKFQCYTPDELVWLRGDGPAPDPWGSQGWTMRDLYEKAQTPHTWFRALVPFCEHAEIPWFSSVFGPHSLKLLEGLGCPAYKLASLDRAQQRFRNDVLATGKPLIQSSPTPLDLPGVVQLYCPPGYPQDIDWEDIADACGWADGLSYHGTDPIMPLHAFDNGMDIVEVHVQLDDVPSELERDVSLTISQLRQLVEARK